MSKFEERIQSSIKEFEQATRSLMKRSSTIVELASSDPGLGNIRRVVERFSAFIGDALKALEEEVEDQPGQEAGPDVLESIDRESMALDCAQQMIRALPSSEEGPSKMTGGACGLRGQSRAVGIPELLSFFASVRKSGMLQVSTPDETFTLVLVAGVVGHAESDNAPAGSRLGDILVEQECLTEGELVSFINENKETNRKLGEALVAEGLISEESIAQALREQIRGLFHRMYSINDATFTFYEGTCKGEEYSVQMDVSGLLLESAVEMDHRDCA